MARLRYICSAASVPDVQMEEHAASTNQFKWKRLYGFPRERSGGGGGGRPNSWNRHAGLASLAFSLSFLRAALRQILSQRAKRNRYVLFFFFPLFKLIPSRFYFARLLLFTRGDGRIYSSYDISEFIEFARSRSSPDASFIEQSYSFIRGATSFEKKRCAPGTTER